MPPIAACLLAILALIAPAASQTNSTSANSSDTAAGSHCQNAIVDANASGIYTFGVDYPLPQSQQSGQATQFIPDPSWAVTVSGGNGEDIERNLWYSPAGQNYADDLGLSYDVCAFVISSLPTNTLRLGQNDPGNCSHMLTERCTDRLKSVAELSAHQWVSYSSPPPYENLTAGVLPSICGYIYRDLFTAAQDYCGNELGVNTDISKNSAVINVQALTGYNDSVLYDRNCSASGDNKTFHSVPIAISRSNSDWRTGTDVGYDNATHDVLPILTVYMPVANVKRTSFYSVAVSALQCVRVREYGEESRVSPALPKGTVWPSPVTGLSTSAKSGVIAGVVVFVILVGSLLLCLWLIKRKKRRTREAVARLAAVPDDETEQLPPEADGSHVISELSPKDRRPEVEGVSIVEMEGGGRPSELANTAAPVELPTESNRRRLRK